MIETEEKVEGQEKIGREERLEMGDDRGRRVDGEGGRIEGEGDIIENVGEERKEVEGSRGGGGGGGDMNKDGGGRGLEEQEGLREG